MRSRDSRMRLRGSLAIAFASALSKSWRSRSLDEVYPIVWMDAIHYKVRDEKGATVSRAIYNVLALDKDGRKDLLGMYVSQSEGANFWLNVLTDLQNRGVKDILIACIDGLTGFPDAIQSVFRLTVHPPCLKKAPALSSMTFPHRQSSRHLQGVLLHSCPLSSASGDGVHEVQCGGYAQESPESVFPAQETDQIKLQAMWYVVTLKSHRATVICTNEIW